MNNTIDRQTKRNPWPGPAHFIGNRVKAEFVCNNFIVTEIDEILVTFHLSPRREKAKELIDYKAVYSFLSGLDVSFDIIAD